MRPRRHLLVDAILFGLLIWVSASAGLSHLAPDANPHLAYVAHAAHAIGGILMTAAVAVHLTLHIPWIRSQLRPRPNPRGQPYPLTTAQTSAHPGGPGSTGDRERRTRHHFPFHGHLVTPYIRLNPRRCTACWECTKACPRGVLGRAILLRHRHAHVDHARDCRGCGKCAKACPNEAIAFFPRRPSRLPAES
jgi:NAD-dependent dihydropyrimidine dehydrogenase PreA subunit